MKTKRGYFTVNNGYVTWFFFEETYASVSQALSAISIIEDLNKLSILILSTAKQELISSRWPYEVRSEFELISKVKRIRLDKRKEEKGI